MRGRYWRFIFAILLPGLGCSERAQPQAPPLVIQRSTAFSVGRDGSTWWLISPAGEKFFSLGVCCINQGTSKSDYDPENPSYAAWMHQPDAAQWREMTLRRLSSWRFTTAGAWSEHEELAKSQDHQLWHTPVLHMGSTSGLPWWDMWDPKNVARMEDVARDKILALRDDPRLLGYYSDNELGWWNAVLWKSTLDQPASSGQRKKLLGLLRERYGSDWAKLTSDFEFDGATGWDELDRKGMLYLKPGGNGIVIMRRFLALLADRYYQLCRDIIRKYDSRALFLGDRYQSFYYPEVAGACGEYVDVVSTNLNAAWNDGTFPRFQLDTLHAITAKPIIVSEIYMSARENRSGNKNDQARFPVVQTQQMRAAAARNTLESFATLRYVVGADWFQYSDEPTHGRFDGENYNFGLVDIADRPYEELTSMLAALDLEQLKLRASQARKTAADGVPPANGDPFENFAPMTAIKNWDRQRGFVKSSTDSPLADLYMCWNPNGVFLALHSWDLIETGYYRFGFIPKEDRALWTVKIGGREIMHARLGAGREAIASDASIRIESIPTGSSVWNSAAMELPAKLLGATHLRAGDKIELDCTLLTHARAYEMKWKTTLTLSD